MSTKKIKKVTTVAERLQIVVDKRFNGVWANLLRATGINPGSADRYKKAKGKPSFDQINQICNAATINPNWLLTGEGPMHSEWPQPGDPAFRARLTELVGDEEPGAFARRAGISDYAWLLMWDQSVPASVPVLQAVAATAGVNLVWLLTGEGPMLKGEDGSAPETETADHWERQAAHWKELALRQERHADSLQKHVDLLLEEVERVNRTRPREVLEAGQLSEAKGEANDLLKEKVTRLEADLEEARNLLKKMDATEKATQIGEN